MFLYKNKVFNENVLYYAYIGSGVNNLNLLLHVGQLSQVFHSYVVENMHTSI